ncbi:MAG: aminotransferase class III-fold pyridoxal phosphate-dependent enzyme, partial [Myxococcales bacterium]|nr:aminotransferase class III-fold pyridoxal phosphate-dependent enzyme [Myxococcales bacterium]
LTCLGKVVGGGLPVGVYGGKAAYMQHVSPLGKVYQAGTLSGNPLATAAGIATLDLLTQDAFDRAAAAADAVTEGLRQVIAETKTTAVVEQVGTMLTLFFAAEAPKNFDEVAACDHARFGRFHRLMLEEGVYLPPSGYEACFLSAEHGPDEVNAIVDAARKALPASAG